MTLAAAAEAAGWESSAQLQLIRTPRATGVLETAEGHLLALVDQGLRVEIRPRENADCPTQSAEILALFQKLVAELQPENGDADMAARLRAAQLR